MIFPFWTKTHSLYSLFVLDGYWVPGGSVHSYWLHPKQILDLTTSHFRWLYLIEMRMTLPLLCLRHWATAAYERKFPFTNFTLFDSIFWKNLISIIQTFSELDNFLFYFQIWIRWLRNIWLVQSFCIFHRIERSTNFAFFDCLFLPWIMIRVVTVKFQ